MEHILTTWLLTYAVHGAMFTALAFVAERTRWGAVASRRDAFWKLALVGGVVTSTVFVAAGSAPSGAAVRLSPQGVDRTGAGRATACSGSRRRGWRSPRYWRCARHARGAWAYDTSDDGASFDGAPRPRSSRRFSVPPPIA